MAAGDVYQLKLSTQPPNVGDEALNIFFYQCITAGATLEEMFQGWDDVTGLQIRSMQSVNCLWNYVEIINLYDLDELFTHIYPAGTVHGVISGDSAPAGVAINFTLQRSSRSVRNGAKRIGGIPNGVLANGIVTAGDYITQLNDTATAFGDEWNGDDGVSTYVPVIVKRIRSDNPDYPVDSKYKYLYRLPENSGEGITPAVADVKFSIYASSQNSRKTNH